MQLFYNSPHFGKLVYDEFFMYYEEPLLFTVTNSIKTKFLCVLSSEENGERKWLFVPVSEQRIYNVKAGYIGVRECFEHPENQLFLIENHEDTWNETVIKICDVLQDYLPNERLYLHINTQTEDDALVEQVAVERRIIFDVRLVEKSNPNLHEVPLKYYAPLVNQLHAVSMNYVRHNVKLKTISSSERKKLAQLDVALPEAGSFIIRFKSHEIADITNENLVLSCILDDLFDLVGNDFDKFDVLIKNCSNQIVSSFRKFMSEILNENYDFEFKSVMLDRKIRRVNINQQDIKKRIDKIDSYLPTKEEIAEYNGYLTGGQIAKRNFVFTTEDGDVIRGKIENKSMETLTLSKSKMVSAKLRVKLVFNEELDNYKEEYTLLDIQY